ncbi:MAG: hypothetical protein JXB26_03500 [Candidatus Aminicenantes bacterium]|nr:hypothetical protein [Candidatus Aminicenantes bacterium]
MKNRHSHIIVRKPRDLSHYIHRRLIGLLGILLPILLFVGAGLFPSDGLPRWGILDSVSAYYYSGSSGVLTGILFALSLFLFSYRGYEGMAADRILGAIGGTAALLVAIFPTEAPNGLSEPSWWSSTLGKIHHGSAVVLFLTFTLFSVWLFRKSKIPKRRDRSRGKNLRNDVCLLCGILMIICILWCVRSKITGAAIVLPESIAIVAFAVSWLVKGRTDQFVKGIMRRVL